MKHWIADLRSLLTIGKPVVRVVVSETRGSAPREAGACMLVHPEGICGTIGGGRLEHAAITQARKLLKEQEARPLEKEFILGKEMEQCCGGIVNVWWQRFDDAAAPLVSAATEALAEGHAVSLVSSEKGDIAVFAPDGSLVAGQPVLRAEQKPKVTKPGETSLKATSGKDVVMVERLFRLDTPVWLYGAGHVGRAIVKALSDLPFSVTWIDSRADMLPQTPRSGLQPLHNEDPDHTVANAPSNTYFLVLTHDHEQDFRIVSSILRRQRFGFVGLIGSGPKAVRFRQRLAREGLPRSLIDQLTCPIGIDGITSKLPAAIAASVAAQLLQLREQDTSTAHHECYET